MDNAFIQKKLEEKFGGQVAHFEEPYGMLTFEASKNNNIKVLQFLFDDPELGFRFLTDLTVVHYPDNTGRELAVVYHLHNLVANVRIRFKVFADVEAARCFHGERTVCLGQLAGTRSLRFFWCQLCGASQPGTHHERGGNGLFPVEKGIPVGRPDTYRQRRCNVRKRVRFLWQRNLKRSLVNRKYFIS